MAAKYVNGVEVKEILMVYDFVTSVGIIVLVFLAVVLADETFKTKDSVPYPKVRVRRIK